MRRVSALCFGEERTMRGVSFLLRERIMLRRVFLLYVERRVMCPSIVVCLPCTVVSSFGTSDTLGSYEGPDGLSHKESEKQMSKKPAQ